MFLQLKDERGNHWKRHGSDFSLLEPAVFSPFVDRMDLKADSDYIAWARGEYVRLEIESTQGRLQRVRADSNIWDTYICNPPCQEVVLEVGLRAYKWVNSVSFTRRSTKLPGEAMRWRDLMNDLCFSENDGELRVNVSALRRKWDFVDHAAEVNVFGSMYVKHRLTGVAMLDERI